MKLLRLKYIKGEHRNPLDGFEQFFHSPKDFGTLTPICLAGINGSGKSKLLEVLSDIFFYLDKYYDESKKFNERTFLQFELEYYLEKNKTHVIISQISEKGYPKFEIVRNDEVEQIRDKAKSFKLLPTNIVGYSSGANETLSKRFEESYLEYSEAVTELADNPEDQKKVQDTRLIFLDNKVNSYVFIANSIFRSKKELDVIYEKVKQLESLESFRIIVQEKPRYKSRLVPIRLTPELSGYLGSLKKCATCYYYEEENEKTILDFYVNKTTQKLFKKYFKSALDLYSSLYKLDLLNDILLRKAKRETISNAEYANQKHLYPQLSSEDKVFDIGNIRVNLSGIDREIDYFDLSDGEHQFVHVLGSLLMINRPDVLFLLDEPETHFNPQWRSKFISSLNRIEHAFVQDFLITTHSPFILGDCKMEHVFIFENGKARNPSVQTYGLSMERLLREAFGVVPPMSEKSLKDIHRLQRSNSLKNIENRIDEFGESIEKVYLFDRLSELKEVNRRKGKKK